MKTDSLFYRLFRNHPGLALDLLGLNYSPDSYRFGAEDIKQTSFRLDGVFTPLSSDAEQPYIFAEIQYQPDPDFYDRLFSEIALYLRINKPTHPWMALVIYPTRGTERPANIGFRPFLTLPQLQRVYLEDFPNREHPTPRLGLLSLIASDPRQTLVLARDWLRQHGDTSTDTLDFIETILVYKLPRLSREEIRLMLGLEDTQLKQTRFYQEAKEEGVQQGVQQGEKLILQRLLVRRFGELPSSVQQRLQQASPEQVEQWADRFVEASSLEAIFANGDK
ncbi:MAG: Rpn family recombination-promoting nuclease/putative transposase [Deltaproteobacteria bacterium]|nr:Rpn family recombination-promoting nuclease/putative transposase [Deltaproteobacteria bacterium]